ncbi:ATP-binding protein [Streptomyces sp. NPDC005775]|uniref:ATP-binding protein n=1 Tax=Streptomyces sp. NPDC005775 TaxID=3364729 RepID=UPI0036748DC7
MRTKPTPTPTAPYDDAPYAPHPAPIPFADPWSYELVFPHDPRGPRIARTTLRAVLGAHELTELSYRAELLTSELTTNSVRHSQGHAGVRLQWRHPVLRVSVWDLSPDLPKPYRLAVGAEAEAEAGRGMAILELVADRWGGCAIGEGELGSGGKTVWFELALTG